MESPVIIENSANYRMPVDQNETGFPFDDSDYDSDNHFQSRLNDIAQRHPEFASHLRFDDFPSLRRKRHGSGSSGDKEDFRSEATGQGPSGTQGRQPGSRFADHSFPAGFNRFPFTRHFDDFETTEPRSEEKPPAPSGARGPREERDKRGRKPNPYLPQHLSNTVDLGQKQPPVEETRSQRSMSAPPENRSSQNTTPSRVDSDTSQSSYQQQGQQEPMGKTYSRQNQPNQQQQSSSQQPRERIIPIHVEGRDDPVLPKNAHPSAPQAEKVFGGERINIPPSYSHKQPQYQQGQQFPRNVFNQFMPQAPPTHQQQQTTAPPTQHPQTQAPPHHQQQQHKQQQQQHEQQQQYQQQQQQQYQQQQEPQPRQPTAQSLNDPLEKIKCVRNDVMELMTKVEQFSGTRKDREYLYLDEMLTRNLLKLDNIETEGKENIRMARKEAIKCIQTCINNLEARAQAKEKAAKAAEMMGQASQETLNENSSTSLIESEKHASETNQPESPKPVYKSQASIMMGGVKPLEETAESEESVVAELMETDSVAESAESTTATSASVSEGSVETSSVDQKSTETAPTPDQSSTTSQSADDTTQK